MLSSVVTEVCLVQYRMARGLVLQDVRGRKKLHGLENYDSEYVFELVMATVLSFDQRS